MMKKAIAIYVFLAGLTAATRAEEESAGVQIKVQANKVHRNTTTGITYGHFRQHKNRRLRSTGRSETLPRVKKPLECFAACLAREWCVSINMDANVSPSDSHNPCELLSRHKHEAPAHELQHHGMMDHYSFENPCEDEPCKNSAKCKPLFAEGDYNCECPAAFTGKNCEEDADECDLGRHNCHANAACTNTHGGFDCACSAGFTGNGVQCTEISPCIYCHERATCIDHKYCVCNENYIGDGHRCHEEDGDCKHLKNTRGFGSNGRYRIRAKQGQSYRVLCEMETESGQEPWTIFQQRINGSSSFGRSKQDYRNGWSDANLELWGGLKMLKDFSKEATLNLRVDLVAWNGDKGFALYENFNVRKDGHKRDALTADYLSGTAGDSLSYHSGSDFSAEDEDSDEDGKKCAKEYGAGWWFKNCPPDSANEWSNLNGKYLGDTEDEKGIIWKSFAGLRSLKSTQMKFQVKSWK